MSNLVRLRVWGEGACFTRPEFKAERVSYPVMTPSAARGVLEAIHWKPAIAWVVERIHVLAPLKLRSIRRNEVDSKVSVVNARRAFNQGTLEGLGLSVRDARTQRSMTFLADVDYLIEARLQLRPRAASGETLQKHLAMFMRRALKGQCFHHPYLGMREFSAAFRLLSPDEETPQSRLGEDERNAPLGRILLDFDYALDARPRFFQARLRDGVLDVRDPDGAA